MIQPETTIDVLAEIAYTIRNMTVARITADLCISGTELNTALELANNIVRRSEEK